MGEMMKSCRQGNPYMPDSHLYIHYSCYIIQLNFSKLAMLGTIINGQYRGGQFFFSTDRHLDGISTDGQFRVVQRETGLKRSH